MMKKINDKMWNIIIVILMIIILGVLCYVLFKDKFNRNYTLSLEGDNPMYLVQGDSYVEPGYHAYDENGLNVTNKVKVINMVNVNQEGLYDITYKIGG